MQTSTDFQKIISSIIPK